MKRFTLLTSVVVLVLAAYWAGIRRSAQHNPSRESAEIHKILYYVDPMNPAHTSDKPGKAPCGMDMEPVYADAMPSSLAGVPAATLPPGTIKVSAEKQQLIGVRLATVEKKRLQHKLRLLGRVATDETRIYRINATVDGWITRTLPNSAGTRVKKDETLAEFYSPEFLAGAQALIYALGAADRATPTGQQTEAQHSQMANFELNLKQYRDALRNLGMGEPQIQELVRTRTRMENVNIISPADGFILTRNVSDGQRFDKGTELFRIADLSRVWILVDVFERDASLVQSDQPLKVELPNQGKSFTATVSKTLPQFDNISRTLKLRLDADNPDFALKPDMFVDVELPLSLPESIVVPAEAVLDAGLRQTVFVALGNGYFEPRHVQVGSRLGEQVQITQGLMPGDHIVVSGNFLLDSESRMKLAASTAHPASATAPASAATASPASDKDPVCGMKVVATEARGAKLTSEYQGKSYFFCGDVCKQRFDKGPEKFLAAAGSK